MPAALLALLLGCGGDDLPDTFADPHFDSGDDDTAPAPDVPFAIGSPDSGDVMGSCADGGCVYRINTVGGAGAMELDITETGDPALYSENHTGFVLDSENADGSWTWRLDLDWATTPEEVVVNRTTLFNPSVADGHVLDRTTWYFGATSADGTEHDCRVMGHDPSWYAERCVTVVE